MSDDIADLKQVIGEVAEWLTPRPERPTERRSDATTAPKG
jgi:hypothetical protein